MTNTPQPNDKDELRVELGGDYLYAEDFLIDGVWRQFTFTVARIYPPGAVKTKENKKIDKPVVEFSNSGKKLVLCKSNYRLAKIVIGSNKASDWVGKKLTLYPAGNVPTFKHVSNAIRVRAPEDQIPYGVRKYLGEDLTGKTVS